MLERIVDYLFRVQLHSPQVLFIWLNNKLHMALIKLKAIKLTLDMEK